MVCLAAGIGYVGTTVAPGRLAGIVRRNRTPWPRTNLTKEAKGLVNSWKGPVVSAKILAIRLHPVSGEDVSVISRDFTGEAEALTAIARAVDERRSLVLTQARYDREAKENGLVVNLANVVTVQVSVADSATTGQYL